MSKNLVTALFLVVMITVIVAADILFFKNRLWDRLLWNIGIVLMFIAVYLRFIRSP